MSNTARTRRGSIKTSLQAGFTALCLITVGILLILSLIVYRYLSSTTLMLFLFSAGVSIVFVVLATILTYFLVRARIDAVFLEAANHCRSYMEGQTNSRIPVRGTDSFAVLVNALNVLFERQNKLIGEMKATRQPQAESTSQPALKRGETKRHASIKLMPFESNEQTEAAEGIQKSSRQVTKAIRTLVDRTAFQEQASRAQAIQIFQTAEKLENLALSVHQLSRNVEGSNSLAQTSLKRLQRTDETLNQAMRGMENLQRNTQRAAQQVYGLSEHTYTMRELIATIEQIATQMTMIAEQALLHGNDTSGEEKSGQELTILLQDLLSLAAQIVDSTAEVSNQMQQIENASQKAVVSLQESNREVAQKSKLVQDSDEMLRDVYQNLQFQASMLRDLAQSATEQSDTIDDASASMSQIAKMAYQSSKETQLYVQGLKKVASLSEQVTLTAGQSLATPLLTEQDQEPPLRGQQR